MSYRTNNQKIEMVNNYTNFTIHTWRNQNVIFILFFPCGTEPSGFRLHLRIDIRAGAESVA